MRRGWSQQPTGHGLVPVQAVSEATMPTFPSSCLHPSPTSLHLLYSCQRLSTPANTLSCLLPPPPACLSTSVHYLRSFIKVSVHQMAMTYLLLPLSTKLLPAANPTSVHPTLSFFSTLITQSFGFLQPPLFPLPFHNHLIH